MTERERGRGREKRDERKRRTDTAVRGCAGGLAAVRVSRSLRFRRFSDSLRAFTIQREKERDIQRQRGESERKREVVNRFERFARLQIVIFPEEKLIDLG